MFNVYVRNRFMEVAESHNVDSLSEARELFYSIYDRLQAEAGKADSEDAQRDAVVYVRGAEDRRLYFKAQVYAG